jgi:3-hydroxy-3-methylglutaryl CoA synthase
LARAQINVTDIRAVWVGSENHIPCGQTNVNLVAEAIGLQTPSIQAADWEIACKSTAQKLL